MDNLLWAAVGERHVDGGKHELGAQCLSGKDALPGEHAHSGPREQRMSRTERDQPADLSRLRRRLDEDGQGGSRGKALPGWVWAAAERLARRHGVYRTARALGLEYNKLKRASSQPAAASGDGRQRAAGTMLTAATSERRAGRRRRCLSVRCAWL